MADARLHRPAHIAGHEIVVAVLVAGVREQHRAGAGLRGQLVELGRRGQRVCLALGRSRGPLAVLLQDDVVPALAVEQPLQPVVIQGVLERRPAPCVPDVGARGSLSASRRTVRIIALSPVRVVPTNSTRRPGRSLRARSRSPPTGSGGKSMT